jgi:signal transduction histidine kinase
VPDVATQWSGVEPHGPVQDTMLRALGILRVVVLLNAVGIYLVHHDSYDHPVVGAVVIAGLAVWTAFVVWAYGAAERRTPWLLVPDLVVAVAAIGISPYVKGAGLNATVPGFWVMGVVLAWAVLWRWVGGLTAAIAVSVVDLSIRDDFTQKAYGNIFLLVLGGAIVGFLSELLQQMAAQRDRAERAAAAAEERQRLARVVHDGVLQALALVQRRAPELGGDGPELGRLAGEQEVRLRGLVQHDSRQLVAPLGDLDLVQLLTTLQTPHVHVAVPGQPAPRCWPPSSRA